MGGNAFDNTVRLNVNDYLKTLNYIKNNINADCCDIPYVGLKSSFGDLDLIVDNNINLTEFEKRFKVNGKVKNGNVVSYSINFFDSYNFQVDLILTKKENFDISKFYFSYNDLNNLVGRIAHKFDLKFGFNGLFYVIKNESGHHCKDVLLSKDPKEIYDFLGYNYSSYLNGFNSFIDLFEFVCSSKYFNADIYSPEELNHINRTRNRKRKTYKMFLEFLKSSKYKDKKFGFSKNKSDYLLKINNYFSNANLFNEMKSVSDSIKLNDSVRSVYNGTIISSLSNLEGKDLGIHIKEFEEFMLNKMMFKKSFGNVSNAILFYIRVLGEKWAANVIEIIHNEFMDNKKGRI